jgi:hypothetical protein
MWLYQYDSEKGRNEKIIRWFELFNAYCHEIGHMFVTYLSLTHMRHIRASTPPACHVGFESSAQPEAGYVLEHLMFGGVYHRCSDNSGRAWEYMVSRSPPLYISIAIPGGVRALLSHDVCHVLTYYRSYFAISATRSQLVNFGNSTSLTCIFLP